MTTPYVCEKLVRQKRRGENGSNKSKSTEKVDKFTLWFLFTRKKDAFFICGFAMSAKKLKILTTPPPNDYTTTVSAISEKMFTTIILWFFLLFFNPFNFPLPPTIIATPS